MEVETALTLGLTIGFAGSFFIAVALFWYFEKKGVFLI
jgi:preprotein translocase subunit SecF